MTKSSGKCLCGAVKFTAEGVETDYHACHCGMCRRLCGGGPFLGATTKRVVFESTESLGRYESSSWAERGFCKTCGATLFYFLKPMQTYMISIGAFDDTSPFRLSREIFIDHKPDAYSLAGDHPRLTEAETLAEFAAKS